MSELNSKARALVRATQFADEPTQADYDRVHAAVAARIAVGLAAGAAVTLGVEAVAASTTAGAASSVLPGSALAGSALNGAAAAVAAALPVAPVAAGAAAGAAAGVGAATSMVAAGGAVAAGTSMGPAAVAGVGTAFAAKVVAWVAVVGAVAAGATAVAKHEQPTSVVEAAPPAPQAGALPLRPGQPSPSEARTNNAAVAVPATMAANPEANQGDTVGPPVRPAAAAPVNDRDKLDPGVLTATATAAKSAPAGVVPAPNAPADTPTIAASSAGPSVPTLDAEVALLHDARAALNDGQPDRALTLLDEHSRRFPSGILAEDRAALRVFALCALGRTEEGRSAGARFVAQHPRSPHASAVQASCAAPQKN